MEYSAQDHFFSEHGPINDHSPIPNFFASMETTLACARHSSSSFVPQEMSLKNINMNRSLPVKVSGASPKSPEELQRGESWENVQLEFSRLSTNSISLCSFEKLWSFYTFPSKLRWHLDVDGSFQHLVQNPKRRRHLCVEDGWILSSPINDRYFHECFSQPIVSKFEISSCSATIFEPMNVADSIVRAINIHQIIDCSSPSPASLEKFRLFRNWSFTWVTNDIDSTDNTNFVVCLPMMKFLENLPLLESWYYEVVLICHEVFLRTLRITRFFWEEFPRDQVELFVPFSKKFYQVALIDRASWPQLSTLEKTKHGRNPILNNLLKRSSRVNLFPYHVALVYLLQQLISMDLDIRNMSSPGSLKLKTTRTMASSH